VEENRFAKRYFFCNIHIITLLLYMRYYSYFAPILLLISITFQASGQHRTELRPGYYVVVGAYAPTRENVAQNYTEVLNRRGFNAAYGFNTSRNYFFVYLKYFTELKPSLQDMYLMRKQSEFADAWVRVIPGDVTATSNNATATEIAETVAKAEPVIKASAPVDRQPLPHASETETGSTQSSVEPRPKDTVEVSDNPEIKQFERITLGNTEVFLSLFNARNNRIVDGMVKVVDTERTKLIKEVKGNEYMTLPDPKSTSGQLTLICEAFGYRKIQQEINYPLPLADTVKDYVDLMGTTFVLNFDLVRYHKGDIATLYNVYFYNDAALMLPESKYELGSLVQMMQENPNYRIRLHGHTNGNYHGRIITMGDNKNFFSLDGSKQSTGTAKDLSFNRAEVIKEYLHVSGIDPSRVEIKAWGGRRPIFDKHSVNAKKNVRVEVEILSE
jgi:outer membrane protein OmpA-like peptidoglycan-associated protein